MSRRDSTASPPTRALDAAARARHMADSIAWFGERLSSDAAYQETFGRLVEALAGCTRKSPAPARVFLTAVGKSGAVAGVLASMFQSIGVRARTLHPVDAFHGDVGDVDADDVIVAISNGGRSIELLDLLPALRERACKIFVLTSQPQSPLALSAPGACLWLPRVSEFCPLDTAPVTSTVCTLALGQLLVSATMQETGLVLAEYARNHPGGAIGKRIFVKVDDLMIRGERLPVVEPQASFQACVSAMTNYALGALLVVAEGGELAGLVTERDLRQAMERWKADVFSHAAHQIMNPKPLVIPAGVLAVEGLRIMEAREKPLNVLPVVGADGRLAGLLRLHELVAAGITLA